MFSLFLKALTLLLLLGCRLLLFTLRVSAPLFVVSLLHCSQANVFELLQRQVEEFFKDGTDEFNESIPLLTRCGLEQQLLTRPFGDFLQQPRKIIGQILLIDFSWGVVAFTAEIGNQEAFDSFTWVPAIDLDQPIDVIGVDFFGTMAQNIDGTIGRFT